ncbi:hypothetical protein [Coraliomargarita parva]|uniref:hypothetical protein n=1 Tax=Coraliomargarita parva TaxID=3014050 RepID=UPI0022B4213F|nr:hypothetical protein [Coraliomargarita parva]
MQKLYLPLLVLFLCNPLLRAESVFEQLQLVETDYRVTVDDIELKVIQQGISLRAVVDERAIQSPEDETVTNHVGYRSYHLELAFDPSLDRFHYSRLEFYKGNELLHRMSISDDSRTMKTSNQRVYRRHFMAVNLKDVPLTLLDEADRINLVYRD